MRRHNQFEPIYSLGFVCEGEKTEPYFVEALHEKVKDKLKYVVAIDIHPSPEPAKTITQSSKRRKNVFTIQNIVNPDPLFSRFQRLPMPENWVETGAELLDTCDEVWVLFDKDGHPNMQQAFARAALLRAQNKRFNVVFSSRCFEHYMLLHYELNYTAFNKSECDRKVRGKTEYADCQLPTAKTWGCDGSLCVNGYARKNGYWLESKNSEAFEQCRNLWWGILNAFHVKWQSVCIEPITKAIYDRNPFLNIYQMTLRMMEMISLEPFAEVKIHCGNGQYHQVSRNGNILHFECQSVIPLRGVELSIYTLPPIQELNAVTDDKHLYEKLITKQTVSLNLAQGNTYDFDLSSILSSPLHYAKMEWGEITYFIAPVLLPIPQMTPSQIEALRTITVTKEMIRAGN